MPLSVLRVAPEFCDTRPEIPGALLSLAKNPPSAYHTAMTSQPASLARRAGEGFRALTELAPDFVAVLDLNGEILYVSPAVTRVLGYPPSELIGRPLLDLVHPDDRAQGRKEFAGLPGVGDIVPARLRYRHKDGSLRVIETLAKNYADTLGVGGVLVSTRDITKHVSEQRALRGAIAEADDLYNNAPCGYHSVDANGVLVRINDTELRWLGRTRAEVVGKMRFQDLLSPHNLPLFERQFPLLKSLQLVENLEFELVRRDGSTLSVLLSATAVTDKRGQFVMSRSTLYDITERKRAESGLRRMNRALRVLGAVNSELMHMDDESALLEAICRLSVELGGYRMAWVGYALQDDARTVHPAAHAGVAGEFLERARFSWGPQLSGDGPTGLAIQTGTLQVNQNFRTNPRVAQWRDDALQCGYESSIALPLKDSSGCFGALMIYAAEPDAFDFEERRLLMELADDLAFGIVTLRARAQHRLAQQKIAHLAYFDALTELPNRARIMEVLLEATGQLVAGKSQLALLTMIVSRFDEILAGIGVRQADDVLRQLAGRLQSALAPDELLARIGGEEFALLLRDADASKARNCGHRIEQLLAEPFQEAGIPISVQLRIGAAVAPGHGVDPESLLLRSGIAARHAKRIGSPFVLYGGPTESEGPRYLALISELRVAIEAKQLILHFQPKVDLAAGRVCGAEALVRWQHPARGLMPPAEFIRVAEQSGLIKPLTYYVLDAALHQCQRWRAQQFEMPVAVNVSVDAFNDPDLVQRVSQSLRSWDIRPELLELEITETTLMEEPSKGQDVLMRLKDQGILVSIDDFGTGYSSLSYLASLPIHALKIDRSFVIRMLQSPRTRSVIEATVSLARSLGIKTVAEGVDAKEQVQALSAMGCSEIQGYFFCRPVEAEPLRRWVAQFALDSYAIRPPNL
jgi:PAS domain S-box-containing protein/diguanylate cyclase (GGDEF)-like protein